MARLGGFWSYTHTDDEAELGRISELARDIAGQYEMLTGETIELFLDRDSIDWGNAWRDKIDGSLATVAFFMPVLTPRYFRSAECRRELRTFAAKADRLGLSELLMPVLYVDFPALHEEDPSDELIQLVKKYQWAIWTERRFDDRTSSDYRRAVSELAARLVAANEEASNASAMATVASGEVGPDDEPGVMDRIAEAEQAMPRWTATIERLTEVVNRVGRLTSEASEQMGEADKRGKGFAGRLTVARQLAGDLDGPADEMVELGNRFAQELSTVDSGVRAIIDIAHAAETDADERAAVLDFYQTLRGLAEASAAGLDGITAMIESIEPVEKLSRDLREPLRRMRQGLTAMTEGRQITNEWISLMDEAGIA